MPGFQGERYRSSFIVCVAMKRKSKAGLLNKLCSPKAMDNKLSVLKINLTLIMFTVLKIIQ